MERPSNIPKCSDCGPDSSQGSARKRDLVSIRPWVQAAFLGVWLAPVGKWLHGIPGCVFHCYSCPLSALGCPVGIAANYAAIFPATFEVPFLLIGMLLLVGILAGSLVCGWACPFGFLQDLLAKLTPGKVVLPAWTGHFRYVVLAGLVILLPMYLGFKGTPFEEQSVSICRLCPAGALEAGLPYSIGSVLKGQGWLMSAFKAGLLAVFVISAMVIYRPWCRVFCPLGGWLSAFNRWSLFHLRFNKSECVECSLCRSRCPAGVKLDIKVNVTGCIRCLECTRCGAIEPALALPRASKEDTAPKAQA